MKYIRYRDHRTTKDEGKKNTEELSYIKTKGSKRRGKVLM